MPKPVSEDEMVAIYRSTIDALYGYVSRRCGGQRAIAEDVTQDAWLRAVQAWHRNGIPDNPIAWLTTVARNLLLNQLRRPAGIAIDEVPAQEILDAVDRDDIGDDPDRAAFVSAAMLNLSPPDAVLLDEFHFQRCRVAQLAQSYGISERAVEGRLRRARERLRRELEKMLPPPSRIPGLSRTGEAR